MISKASKATLFSQTAEYALRAVVLLAEVGGGPLTTHEIADRADIPGGYLSKVLRRLANAGILTAQRGVGGGFALGRPPASITALEVVETVDGGIPRITRCPLGRSDHHTLCPLHSMIDRAACEVEAALASTTIDTLVGQSGLDLSAEQPSQ